MKIEDFNIGDRVRVIIPDTADEKPRYKQGYEGEVEYLRKGFVYVFFDKFEYCEGEYGDVCFPTELEVIHD